MGEVVHLSFGPQANNLNASFYNQQESYFVYTAHDAAQSCVNPRVRFAYGTEFTPRAVFWDFRNGLGHWHRFSEKYEEAESKRDVVIAQNRPVHVEASRASLPSWTNRLRVPVHPTSMHEIPGWEIDPQTFPFGRQRGAPPGQDAEFALMDEGLEQFSEASRQGGWSVDEYLDDTFRPTLEKCDQLDGVNVVTDLGGWAGFTAAYLEALRDDYIPKKPIFTWALSRQFATPRMSFNLRQSRIQALASFSEFSSLVIPMQDTHAADFAANAEAFLARFETMCLLSSLRHKPVSMYDIAEELTFGVPNANIIQSGQAIQELDAKAKSVKNRVVIDRSATQAEEPSSEVDDGSGLRHHHWCPQPFKDLASTSVQFELNDNPLRLRKLVPVGNHELKELVYDLTDDYVWHWEDSDDSF